MADKKTCDCALRDRRWNPVTGKCQSCGRPIKSVYQDGSAGTTPGKSPYAYHLGRAADQLRGLGFTVHEDGSSISRGDPRLWWECGYADVELNGVFSTQELGAIADYIKLYRLVNGEVLVRRGG